MAIRRRLLTQQNNVLDTSPVVEENGVYWSRTFGQTAENTNWCVTKFYGIDDPYTGQARTTNINGFIGADTNQITFQYYLVNGSTKSTNWYYFAGTNPRRALGSTVSRLTSISFSIQKSELPNSYAYIVETGQILFAGRNTIYYGHRNISELS